MKRFIYIIAAILGFVACEETQNPIIEQTLQLTADNEQIYANGQQTATFTVKDAEGTLVEDATIYFESTNEALEGNTFKTKYAGTYTFYAQKGNAKSNTVTITAKEVTAEDKVVTLSVSPSTIVADGTQSATFAVTCNGESVTATIYNAADDSALAENVFTTTVAGEYTFYALYEEARSNEVKVTATAKEEPTPDPEKAITIAASASTFKANGVDSITFTVTEDGGADVTSACSIYANGGKLQSNKLSTTTPGTYTIYAMKGEVKSNEISVTAEEVATGDRTTVFAEGVTLTSGWYDVNKYKQGDNGDIQMCWAASSSNIIQWWQDRYVAHGGTLPETAINGPSNKTYSTGCKYQLALMDMYHSEWDNSLGGHVNEAIPWYFEGKLNGGEFASPGTQAVPLSEGGYWKSIWSSVVEDMYCGYDYFSYDTFDTAYSYTVRYNNYDRWGNGTALQGVERLKYFTDLTVEAFEHGMASMTISLAENIYSQHHAVTLWGYEIDNATGLLTKVWITDSDDMTTEPKREILHEMTVSIGEGQSHIKLSSPDIRYKNVWVVAIVPVAGPNSAK